ncbi:hypothetical protein M9H77_33216 [Catharanthus roseus]|uniref:Uncharacterized protein n=1 Tax=Catharanthus roseus TaxID=4058 RepID=A0ACB9ZHZ4_CATRO|nr:hypothetical protein M9H77_33216 [Catharanthus roseus]
MNPQGQIMVLLLLVSVGYIFLWIMRPTNVYFQEWWPKIVAQTNSIYLGEQGANIFLYTLPVLFVAVLGCVYLHLGKKSYTHINLQGNGEKTKMSSWKKRPMIIKGLGIVSHIEIAFLVMFIGLLVWSFSNYLSTSLAQITPASAAEQGQKLWEAKLESMVPCLGLVGNICLGFLFFPVTRGSSLLQVFGLTSEASIKYHIWLGHIVMLLFTAHALCCIILWGVTHQLWEGLKWKKTNIPTVGGQIALLSGLAMWATTFPRIRRKMFELFFYTHHLYIIFIFFFVIHVGISFACIILPGFFLFIIDRYLRFLQSHQKVNLVFARILPCETVELTFSKSKGLSYTPTSILFVNVPSISKLQWHPFSITSSSNLEPEKLSVIIKGEGNWSKKLYHMLSTLDDHHLSVSVEGPYGPTFTDFLRHDMLVMVSGGSGITPFISIIRELMYANETQKHKTPQILLISAFKNSSDLTMLDLLLPITILPSKFSNLNLQIEAYVTREKQPPISIESNMNIRTFLFKPKSSNSPISPVLGQNNWFWLGAIISSSFIIFVILIAILNRYHIGKNTNEIYPYSSSRVALNILFMCCSIFVTSTIAFLWNKKINAMESSQIQNLEGANSGFYNGDRELESLPQQMVSQFTNVHYGERPNLKRILLECKESTSVGVLACGPKKLRHEVANICSSYDLATNLHFESISFSW